MLITTVKELKEAINDLPDDMKVYGYDGHDYLSAIRSYKADEVEALIVTNELPAIIGHDWVVEA